MKLISNFESIIAEEPCVFVHQGDNGRRGSIFVYRGLTDSSKDIAYFYEVYCASTDRETSLSKIRTAKYSIRNFEKELLEMSGYEHGYYSGPVLVRRTLDEIPIPFRASARELYYLALEEMGLGVHPENSLIETANTKGNKTMTINLKTAAAIVDETVTTIDVSMSSGNGTIPDTYTYLCAQSLASSLTEGDKVLVEASNRTGMGVKVAVVNAVHNEPNVELNTDIIYRWAFQKVDTAALEAQQQRQDKLHQMLKERQRTTTRQSVLASLGLTQSDILSLE